MTTTLTAVCSHEEDIKKSRFVAHAAPVSSIDEAMAFFAAHSDPEATHNCWAYRIGQEYRFNDDGEPGGTAGRPILQAIEGQGMDRVALRFQVPRGAVADLEMTAANITRGRSAWEQLA